MRGLAAPKWVRAVEAHPDTATLRADGLRNLTAVVWALATSARPDGTTCPTWPALTEQAGLSERTVARWLAWLRTRGLLFTVETGSTPGTRGGRQPEVGNRAAVYALTGPLPVDGTVIPPCSHVVRTPYTREGYHDQAQAACGGGASTSLWPRLAPGRTRADRLLLAEELRRIAPDLRELTPRQLRAACGPELRAGWSIDDVLFALDHEPEGRAHWRTAKVKNRYGWVRSRLAPWGGRSRAQRLAQARAIEVERARRARTEFAAADAAATPMPARFRDCLPASVRRRPA